VNKNAHLDLVRTDRATPFFTD